MPKGHFDPPTFEGRPCRKCGSTTRYANGAKRCVACNRNYVARHTSTRSERDEHRGQPCPLCQNKMDQPCFDEVDGTLRGWICHDCNKGIGWFQNKPWLLRRAARYVEEAARTGREVTSDFLDVDEELEEDC